MQHGSVIDRPTEVTLSDLGIAMAVKIDKVKGLSSSDKK